MLTHTQSSVSDIFQERVQLPVFPLFPSTQMELTPPPFKISLCSLVVDSAPLLLLSIYYPCQAWRPRLTLFWMMRVREGRVREGVDLRFFFPFRFQFQVEIYMRKCLD